MVDPQLLPGNSPELSFSHRTWNTELPSRSGILYVNFSGGVSVNHFCGRKRAVRSRYDGGHLLINLQVGTAYGYLSHPCHGRLPPTEDRVASRDEAGNGRAYAQHFTLSRLTGELGYYDDGTRHGETWTCQGWRKANA